MPRAVHQPSVRTGRTVAGSRRRTRQTRPPTTGTTKADNVRPCRTTGRRSSEVSSWLACGLATPHPRSPSAGLCSPRGEDGASTVPFPATRPRVQQGPSLRLRRRRLLARAPRLLPQVSPAIFGTEKIARNRERDERVNRELSDLGWHVLRLWDFEIERDPAACVLRVQPAIATAQAVRDTR